MTAVLIGCISEQQSAVCGRGLLIVLVQLVTVKQLAAVIGRGCMHVGGVVGGHEPARPHTSSPGVEAVLPDGTAAEWVQMRASSGHHLAALP
jgi:hypothetical protein